MEERCGAVALRLWRPAVCSGLGATRRDEARPHFLPKSPIRCMTRHIHYGESYLPAPARQNRNPFTDRPFGPVTIGIITDPRNQDSPRPAVVTIVLKVLLRYSRSGRPYKYSLRFRAVPICHRIAHLIRCSLDLPALSSDCADRNDGEL